MLRERLHFLFLNVGHFLDHLFMLIFATVAALTLSREWGMSYAELVPYATPGFIAFGLFSLPAGRLADRWSRRGMIAVFFNGAGATAILTALAQSPLQIALCLFLTGIFAAIYHPVGLALVVDGAKATGSGMAIAVNGVWGNLGVGSAALLTGYFIDHGGWRGAFVWPGLVSIAIGGAYLALTWPEVSKARLKPRSAKKPAASGAAPTAEARAARALFLKVAGIIFFTTAMVSLIFQSTTFALPKIFAERLGGITGSATDIGWMAFFVFAVASVAQLIVGAMLDRLGPRTVFLGLSAMQIVFFAAMPGLTDWWALAVALGFMMGAFGQIPINDYMIGRMASAEKRASIYGARFVVAFMVLAAALPFLAWMHKNYGFDRLFQVLAVAAAAVLMAVLMLPAKLPSPEAETAAVPAKA